MEITGVWNLPAIDGADVRLRSGSISVMSIDISAPVRSGSLSIETTGVTLDLVIALDKLRTANFLAQAAARSFITSNSAHDLVYKGFGAFAGASAAISGQAQAGTLDLTMNLTVTLLGGATPTEVELVGATSFGEVHIPLPGVGKVDDLLVDVDARLAMVAT
jgi:hypothetical protein